MRKKSLKPSKTQSVIGFIVGLCFIGFGLTTFIKIGVLGILWTGLAFIITIMHGINIFTHRGNSTMSIEDSDKKNDIEGRLSKLDLLRVQRLITSEEYDIKKTNVLQDL
ncbi:MAG: hypothetical protein JXR88_13195 [Clostridia bacterium]|nr:hypothetical protein [Clostridia bacterium]